MPLFEPVVTKGESHPRPLLRVAVGPMTGPCCYTTPLQIVSAPMAYTLSALSAGILARPNALPPSFNSHTRPEAMIIRHRYRQRCQNAPNCGLGPRPDWCPRGKHLEPLRTLKAQTQLWSYLESLKDAPMAKIDPRHRGLARRRPGGPRPPTTVVSVTALNYIAQKKALIFFARTFARPGPCGIKEGAPRAGVLMLSGPEWRTSILCIFSTGTFAAIAWH